MKNYYIPEINIYNIKLANLNINKSYIQRIFLTPYGKIINKKNKFFKQKLNVNSSYKIDNFLKKFTLLVNDTEWETFSNELDITDEHEVLEKKIFEIKLNENSHTILKIEYIDDTINDFYFTSNNECNTIFFKNDISSFIKMLI